MKKVLETERLILREYTLDDTQFVIQLLNTEGWLAFIGDKNVHTEDEAKTYLLNGPIKSYAENGYGLSLVKTKNDMTPIGMCGLIKRDNLDAPDIGFAFLPEFTGKGYAFEIADAIITYAKNTLKLPKVYGITMPENEHSKRLLQKIGLSYQKMYTFPNQEAELMLLCCEFSN